MTTTKDFILGGDTFGGFTISHRVSPDVYCDCCGKGSHLRLHYDSMYALPRNIDPEATILHNPQRMWIGIPCGCYAKLHRQVAHIADRMKKADK